MKTKRIFALVLSVLLVVAMIPAMAFAEEPTGTSADNIVILATNDVHCAVDTGIGYVNLAAYKEQLKKNNKYVTLVDAGDAIQGEAIGTLSKGEDLIKIMNYLGYEFAVPGNHEFDYGMDQFLNTIVPKFGGTYLSCNFVDLATGEPVFDAYEIKTYGSRKVAYVGICTPETFTKSTPTYFQNEQGEYIYSFCQGNNGQDLYDAVQNAVDAAKNAGADYVIAVGHLGTDEASTPWTSTEVIANTTGIDAFIDGHSHSTFAATAKNKDGENVATVSTGTKLQNIGKVIISGDGDVSTALVSAAEITEKDIDEDAFIAADAYITGELLSAYQAKLHEVVAHSDAVLTINGEDGKRLVRSGETNLGDLCADAYRIVLDADIAFVNGGGIRVDIPAGDITFEQIINVHPFGNMACVVEATGQQILDALEMGAKDVGTGENGGFLQVSGLSYKINTYIPSSVELNDENEFVKVNGAYRVSDVLVGGEPLDLEKTYKLASHNYMLKSGGDGLVMFKNDKILLDEVMLDNQVLITYIQDYLDGKVGEEYAASQGRIKIVNQKPDDIVILATNDVHCGIDKKDETDKTIGYAGLAAYKKQMEAANKYVTLVDAGDAIQGDAIGTLSKGEYLIDIMNQVGYAIAVPGNHEFDYGMDQFLKTIVPKFSGTYLSCNFVDLATGEPVFDAYEIKTYGDRKVAYVGICTPETFTKSTPTYFQNEQGEYIYGFCQGNNGQDLYDAVQKAVDAAKNAGADYVIAVGHLGTDEASTPWTSTEVIANTTGIDAFIDGHSHSTFAATAKNKAGKDVATVSTGTKLENIGKVIISEAGEVSTALVSAAQITGKDTDTDAFIAGMKEKYEKLVNSVVAYSDVDLAIADENDVRQVRSQETNLGDLCADAYRIVLDADIAFVNGGGIRTAIPKGNITYGDIIAVHPFGNMACVVEATGQQILDALEMGSRNVGIGENGGFLQVSGLSYNIKAYIPSSVELNDEKEFVKVNGRYRVSDVLVGGEPLDLEKTYKLASHNYLLKSGGDGLVMFKNNKVLQDEVMVDNQVLITYIQDYLNGKVGEEYAAPQGRIKIQTERPTVPMLPDTPSIDDGNGEDTPDADIQAELDAQNLVARSSLVTMKNGKKAVKVVWYEESGKTMDFDGVEIFRSTKRHSGYGKEPIFETSKDAYYNTAIEAGTKYYYKVRGYVMVDGEKCYTDWSAKAWRTVA